MTEQTRTINHSVTIEASAETVFKALTDAGELIRWFTTTAESDPRTGGKFQYRFENPAKPKFDHTREGTYQEVVPNQKVTYPWNIPGMEPSTIVAIRLQGSGAITTITLAHTGWPAAAGVDEAYQMHMDGWGFFLQNLKTVLEGGQDQRESALGMRTTVPV